MPLTVERQDEVDRSGDALCARYGVDKVDGLGFAGVVDDQQRGAGRFVGQRLRVPPIS